MADSVDLRVDGKTLINLPIIEGSEGERAIDIRNLRDKTGLITLDPGYANTGSCRSAITFVDGDRGILRYRGISIEDLAAKSTFLEVAYLLIYGSLPNKSEYESFVVSITRHSMIHEDFKRFFGALPKDAHPMAACSAAIGALSTFYPDSLDPRDPRQIEISVHRLIAKIITVASYAYKHSIGQPFLYPQNDRSYVSNFLYMLFGTPCEEYEVDPVIEQAIDLLFILHADHEQNCSTSTVRLAGLFAGQPVLFDLCGHQRTLGSEPRRCEPGSDRDARGDSGRGRNGSAVRRARQGGRFHRSIDGLRSPCLQELRSAHDDHQEGVLRRAREAGCALEAAGDCRRAGRNRPQGRLLRRTQALSERRLLFGRDLQRDRNSANLFTAFFAIGRMPGWIAQWREMHSDPDFKIGRPRQIFTGSTATPYVPLDER